MQESEVTELTKQFWEAAWIRALRSFVQAIVAQIPAGFVITPAMIQYFNVSYLYVILAIVVNAFLYALASLGTSILTGLPEVDKVEFMENDAIKEAD